MEWLSIRYIQGCTRLSKAGLEGGVTNDVTVNSLQLQNATEMKRFAFFFSHSPVLVPFCVDCCSVGVFSQVANGITRGNSLRLHQRKFTLDIRMNFFTTGVATRWNRLPREMAESLEVFKI